jgi:hypothetical protein
MALEKGAGRWVASPFMTKRWIHAAMVGLVAACASCGPAMAPVPPRTFPGDLPDLATKNLPPDEEIAALLAGLQAVGKPGATSRVAVAPFKVLGGNGEDWVGEATSELVAAKVSGIENVSVLERGELAQIIAELKRSEGEVDPTRAVQLGKLVGAQHMILGKVILSGGDHWTLIVHAVKVETGAWTKATEVQVTRGNLPGTVAPAAAVLAEGLGGTPESARTNPATGPAPIAPLDAKALETASRARALQYEGKLLEAQPLYAEALASPSNAWRFEADYVRLLMDLGLSAFGGKHGREVLGRMPVSKETACDRARIMLEVERELYTIEETRDTVRTAASCGDDTVTALALRHYANAMEGVHYPTALAALEKAHTMIGATTDRWSACWIEWHRYLRQSEGGDWQGRRDEHLAAIAKTCEEGGNVRVQAKALLYAGDESPDVKRRAELYEQAEKAAKIAGGVVVDEVTADVAGDLRRQGRRAAADQKILDALGVRIAALVELHGGLPAPLDRLDADVLRGAHAADAKPTTAPAKEALVAQAHRAAAASLLRSWAERTRSESNRQAQFYESIADEMDPPTDRVPANESADARLDRTLAASKLPLAKITEMSDPPPRASGANPYQAYWALSVWLSSDRVRDDAKHKEVLAAAKKLAIWVDRSTVHRNLLMEEAYILEQKDLHPQALASARATMKYAPDDPVWATDELAFEAAVQKKSDPAAMAETHKRRIEAAKKVSGWQWVWAVYQLAYDGVDTHSRDARAGIVELIKCSEEMDAASDYAAAAEALRLAGVVANEATHRPGSQEDMLLMRQRVSIIDKLGDPLRSLEARIDAVDAVKRFYSEGWPMRSREYLAKEPFVTSSMVEVQRRLGELVAAGMERDAARLVARIPVGAQGLPELAPKALEWSEHFKDSVEYPMIAARIWSQRGSLATRKDKELEADRIARDLFVKAGDVPSAVGEARWLLHEASTEAELWAALDACLEIARSDKAQANYCIDGVAGAIEGDVRPSGIQDLGKLRATLQKGRELMTQGDAFGPKYRVDYRGKMAQLAALAGEWETMSKLDAEVQDYARKNPTFSYRFGVYLGAMAMMSSPRDPKRAVEFCQQFDRENVAAPVWKATQYYSCWLYARWAKDTKAGEFFDREGREAARRGNLGALPTYDLAFVGMGVEKKDYKAAAKGYKKTAETVRKFMKEETFWASELDVYAAYMSLFARDTMAAGTILNPMVKESERRLKTGERFDHPCFDAQVVALAAASKMASGQCAEGERLREVASQVRTQCREEVCRRTSERGTWCDGPNRTFSVPQNACRKPVPPEPNAVPYSNF